MSLRGWVLTALSMTYGAVVSMAAIYLGDRLAWSVANPFAPGGSALDALAVFGLVFAVIAGVGLLPVGRLMRAYKRFWDARWDEDGQRWAEPTEESPASGSRR